MIRKPWLAVVRVGVIAAADQAKMQADALSWFDSYATKSKAAGISLENVSVT